MEFIINWVGRREFSNKTFNNNISNIKQLDSRVSLERDKHRLQVMSHPNLLNL
jgi:hypothetical protein